MGKSISGVATARARCWVGQDGTKLVSDGHEDARVLFARAGQALSINSVRKFPNASEFFANLAEESESTAEPAENKQLKKGKKVNV